jgi:polar amino acid transport system substrate-binding protein
MRPALLLSGICSSVLFLSIFAAADTITIAGDSWCPFNCETGSANPGYMVEIAQQVFGKAGHVVVYKIIPWARAKEESRAGQITGIIGAYKDDAPDFIFPANEQGVMANELFVLAESGWKYEGLTSLSSATLGIIADYSYYPDVDGYIEKNKANPKLIQTASGDNALETNIKKLQGGRITAIIETPAVFWYTANRMGISSKLKSAGAAGKADPISIAFSPKLAKSKDYAALLATGMTDLRKSGELAKILKKYALTDWKK